jgi:hypothetical protein
MMKTVLFSGYSVVIAGFICCLSPAAPVFAQGGGYEGLIAPAAPESSAPDTTDTSSGYEGLLAPAPAPASRGGAARQDKDEPPGYSGLIPGRVEDNAGGGPPAQMTSVPGTAQPIAPKSAEDIGVLSTLHGIDRNGDGIPDDLMKPGQISRKTASALGKPHKRIDNMLPAEYAARKNIDQLMPGVRDKKISAAVRAERVRNTQERLATLANGLRQKKAVPDRIYKAMGVPDIFVQEEKEGADQALLRLDKALKELKEYE